MAQENTLTAYFSYGLVIIPVLEVEYHLLLNYSHRKLGGQHYPQLGQIQKHHTHQYFLLQIRQPHLFLLFQKADHNLGHYQIS